MEMSDMLDMAAKEDIGILTVVRKDAHRFCKVVSPCEHPGESCPVGVIIDGNVTLLHVLCVGGAVRRALGFVFLRLGLFVLIVVFRVVRVGVGRSQGDGSGRGRRTMGHRGRRLDFFKLDDLDGLAVAEALLGSSIVSAGDGVREAVGHGWVCARLRRRLVGEEWRGKWGRAWCWRGGI